MTTCSHCWGAYTGHV